jgi:hypothetical protein
MTKPLFDEDFEDDDELEVGPMGEPLPTERAKKFDKIFNNDYNTGNLDFEEFGPPKVDQDFVDKHMESYYDSQNYHNKMQTVEKLDEFFKESEVGKIIGMKKKIPKQMIPRLYVSMKDAFKEGEMSEIEFFSLLAEYFGMSYEVFYENIPAVYRETLVRELDHKYGVLKKKGIRKLF